jgi:succinate dehydrogenase / fumarate reductase cytochrome b subunit
VTAGVAMQKSLSYLSSAIGRKQLMAITGLVWSGFVLTHMAANLLIPFSAELYNKYSHALITNPAIYLAEGLLVLTLLVHIANGVKLTLENRGARPQNYAMGTNGSKAPRFQSTWMIYHGSLLAVFLIWHLLTFKFGRDYQIVYDGVQMRDLHRLVIETFAQPAYVIGYALCMVGVGLHLSHGFYSSFATLGFYHPRYSPMIQGLGYVYSFVVAAGFIIPPLYVLMTKAN